MAREAIATRRFGMADQLGFAALSGDYNPIHVDALAARRTRAGAPVVHGVHALLWGLDALAGAGIVGAGLGQIAAQFREFIHLDADCEIVVTQHDALITKAELRADGAIVASLRLSGAASEPMAEDPSLASCPDVATVGDAPNAPALAELADLRGWISARASAAELAHAFPRLAGVLGAERVAGIAAVSRLVGMVCPGLHSVLATLTIDLAAPQSPRPGIGFKVVLINHRLQTISMAFGGSGVAGKVTTFMRWPPVEAPGMETIAAAVGDQEFAGAVALVIGGSRGLGAVAAKVIAAGGGRVVLTYAKGRAEAERVAQDIERARGPGICTTLAYDAGADAAAQLASLSQEVDQLYYFATPPILKRSAFSQAVLNTFHSIYVDGFDNACRFVRARSHAQALSAFYPSSVYAGAQPPAGFAEYVMAKRAGEVLCAELTTQIPTLRILCRRLPRVLTDQTAAIAHADNADALTVMLPLMREMQRLV